MRAEVGGQWPVHVRTRHVGLPAACSPVLAGSASIVWLPASPALAAVVSPPLASSRDRLVTVNRRLGSEDDPRIVAAGNRT